MTTKRRVYYRADGRVAVVVPAERSKRDDESEAGWLKRVYKKTDVHKEGLEFDDIDVADLPSDKLERGKWRGSKGQGVHVDASIKTRDEKRKELENAIDVELQKPNPSAKKVMTDMRKLSKGDF